MSFSTSLLDGIKLRWMTYDAKMPVRTKTSTYIFSGSDPKLNQQEISEWKLSHDSFHPTMACSNSPGANFRTPGPHIDIICVLGTSLPNTHIICVLVRVYIHNTHSMQESNIFYEIYSYMITVYEWCIKIYYTNSFWYYTQSHNKRTIMQATQQNWVGLNKKPWKTSRYRDMLIYTDSTKKKVDGRNPAPPGMYKTL